MFTALSSLLNLIGIKALTRVHHKMIPIELTSLVTLWGSLTIANLFWMVDVSLKSIQSFNLSSGFEFLCYLLFSRQVCWVTRHYSFFVIALNRLLIVRDNLVSTRLNKKSKTNATVFQRYKLSILVYSLLIALICLAFFPGYFIHDVFHVKSVAKCSR